MKDMQLALAKDYSVDTGNTANVVDLTGFGGQITFISNAIPLALGFDYGTERMTLEVVCAAEFADSCTVTMELISYSAADLVSVGTALILGGYSSHWISAPLPNTVFFAGRRMATIPLVPGQEIQKNLMLLLRFSAETTGRINAYLTPLSNAVQYPAPNAI